MSLLTQSAGPSYATPAPAQEAAVSSGGRRAAGGAGNAAAQERAGIASPAPETADPDTERNPAWAGYGRRLWDRVGALMTMEDTHARRQASLALLAQAVRVQDALEGGEPVDVEKLPREPQPDSNAYPVSPFPPEWIGAARHLLEWANPPIQGETPVAEMLSRLGREGKEAADYGVSSYQTQSNNLAAPEATCNGTSLAMVLERLGFSRDDLVETIEIHLKRQQLTQQLRRQGLGNEEIRKEIAKADWSCVFLANHQWEARVRGYLQAENQRGSSYQRPRGATASGAEIEGWSKAFKKEAGLDDLALMLMSMLGIERTEISMGSNPERVIAAVHEARGGPRPTTERIDAGRGWSKTKPILQQVLEEGGAAMISILHKGAGEEGSHIAAIQACTPDGCIVDDPYGRIRASYTARKSGDAYGEGGKSRAASGLKNAVDTDRDDWMRSAEVSPDETRGMNSAWSDRMITESWRYVLLFRRGDGGSKDAA
jgi:hypothetical protein